MNSYAAAISQLIQAFAALSIYDPMEVDVNLDANPPVATPMDLDEPQFHPEEMEIDADPMVNSPTPLPLMVIQATFQMSCDLVITYSPQ